jgi:hypothetical protein
MGRNGKKDKRDYLTLGEGKAFPKSKKVISRGLKVLGQLWARGLKPRDLRLHFFLTWFAWTNGNVMLLAQLLGMHRNTINLIFKKERGTADNLRLRMVWKNICESHPGRPFLERFHGFYKKVGAKPFLTASQNSALAALWLMGMPRKALRANYIFWGLQHGITRVELARKLGICLPALKRIKRGAIKKGTAANVWLSPMNPRKKDWYPGREPQMKRKARRK